MCNIFAGIMRQHQIRLEATHGTECIRKLFIIYFAAAPQSFAGLMVLPPFFDDK